MVQPNLDPTYALAKDISDAQARIGRLEQADIAISGLHDVTLTSQTQGQALTWDATAKKWVNSTPASTLAGLTDVSLTSPTNAQVLTYNSALSKWINATGGGGGSFTVSATAPSSPTNGAGWYNLSNGLIFFYINDGDSSQWVQDTSIANDAGYDSRIAALETFNTVAQPVAVGGTGASTLTAGGYLKGNGSSAVTSQVGIPGSDIVGYMSPNYIINGGFDIWQRGTSFTTTAAVAYTADRWMANAGTGATLVTSQQTFTPGAAPVAGYEGTYFCRVNRSTTGSATSYFLQRIEDVRAFAGQTATVSFWAKASSNYSVGAGDFYFYQNFGTGGSTGVGTSVSSATTITTSWQRFSYTVAVPSISGKTIGANSFLELTMSFPTATSTFTLDVWGMQVEQGSVATPFRRNANSIQGELAACQRYYYRKVAEDVSVSFGLTSAWNGHAYISISHPITMRVKPPLTSLETSGANTFMLNWSGAAITPTGVSAAMTSSHETLLDFTGSFNNNQPYLLQANNNAAAYIGFSAEL